MSFNGYRKMNSGEVGILLHLKQILSTPLSAHLEMCCSCWFLKLRDTRSFAHFGESYELCIMRRQIVNALRSQLNWTQYTGPWFKSQTQTRESTMNWQRPTTAGPPVSWNGKRTQSRPGWVDLFYDQNRPNWIPWYTVCHWLIPSSIFCTEPYCL